VALARTRVQRRRPREFDSRQFSKQLQHVNPVSLPGIFTFTARAGGGNRRSSFRTIARPCIMAAADATLKALETRCVHATFAVKRRPHLANILPHSGAREDCCRVRVPAHTRFISAHMAAAPSTVTFGVSGSAESDPGGALPCGARRWPRRCRAGSEGSVLRGVSLCPRAGTIFVGWYSSASPATDGCW